MSKTVRIFLTVFVYYYTNSLKGVWFLTFKIKIFKVGVSIYGLMVYERLFTIRRPYIWK